MKLGEFCAHCHLVAADQTEQDKYGNDAIDPCLGRLPGVKYACCGHGDPDDNAYIYFENGKIIQFQLQEIWDKNDTLCSFVRSLSSPDSVYVPGTPGIWKINLGEEDGDR